VPPPSTLGLFTVAALALLVTPGPSVLYIVTRSMDQGRRAGLASVLGIHTGSIVHVAAAALGLSALLVTSAATFTVVKLGGAAYLIAIGLRRLFGAVDEDAGRPAPSSLRKIYGQGVIVNVLNPKTAIFFFAFLPQFIDPDRGPIALQTALLGVVFIAIGMLSDTTYAVAAGALGARLRDHPRFARRRQRLSGGIYVGLGLSAALVGTPRRS
jgi:threonine/homoserine/homoserine lactone efflux protein